MKSDIENNKIDLMCESLGAVAYDTGNYLDLHYNEENEMVTGSFNGEYVSISVGMSSVAASFRDVLRGLAQLV